MSDQCPQRSRPAHQPPVDYRDRPVILMVTVCTKDRRPLLASGAAHERILSAWRQADRWAVGRYIILPDHLHFFCSPLDVETSLKTWMEFWRAGVTRSWPDPQQRPIWQKDYWDTQLRRGESYAAKWEYVVGNAVKDGLIEEASSWPYQGEMNVLMWSQR